MAMPPTITANPMVKKNRVCRKIMGLSKQRCFPIVYAETKNSGLHRSVSRCNRSVDQLGLEPRTSRL